MASCHVIDAIQKSEGFYIMEQSENGKASRWNFDNLHYDHVMYANGLFCVWNQDVESVRISNPRRIWSPCGDDFVSSEEELPCGGDFVSSEEELSCGDDFVT
ncbi:hypothetical protein T459_35030 [Capsicum annuum]|uniref:Uncharacterized protein n=1 Tax=Capsicum annuum TaxID=4072 RepID=A0A2G2XUG4_CAPAN|nr:hypothetical protein T459_35030 [Capsicum annuum]